MAFRSSFVTLVCAAALAACSTTQAADPLGATCDTFRAARVVEQTTVIAVGTEVNVVLCSNPSTGLSWEEARVVDASVVEVVDHAYQAPAAASVPIVGSAGAEILTLRGLTAGSTSVSVSYGQPWAGGTKGEWTYSLVVTVR